MVHGRGDVDRDRTVVARRIVECQRFVTDRPFARGEVSDRKQRGKRSQNGNSTFHNVRPRTHRNSVVGHDDVTGRLNISALRLNDAP